MSQTEIKRKDFLSFFSSSISSSEIQLRDYRLRVHSLAPIRLYESFGTMTYYNRKRKLYTFKAFSLMIDLDLFHIVL